MKEVLKLEIQVISIVHIIAIVLSIVFFMIFYMKADKDHAVKSFLVVQLSMIGWMIFKIFKTVSPTTMTRWWFIVAYYFCACVLEIAFLEFGYAYYKKKPLSMKVRRWAYVLPLIQFLVVLTNPYHHLFYAKYTFRGDSFGPLFYLHTLLEYLFITVGFVYCYKQFKVVFRNKKKWYKYLVSSAILIPLILNFFYITKILHRVVFALGLPVIFDITPIVFTWSAMIFVHATFNSDFLNLSPILKHEIVHKLDTPICLLDSGYDVIYINEKLEAMFKGDSYRIIKGIVEKIQDKEIGMKEVQFEAYYLEIEINEVQTLLETQHILTVTDISSYREIEAELSEKEKILEASNEELEVAIKILKETSKIGARGYVARELHDIIGHSLVVTIKLLEVAKVYFEKDPVMSLSAVSDAYSAIDSGIVEMRKIKDAGRADCVYTGDKLKKEIEKIFREIKNIDLKTKLLFKGSGYNLDVKTFDIISKVCTELVTNSIKHSQCKEIFISVNLNSERIQLLVMDNGVGTDHLINGNGLKGIESRLALVGGRVEFITSMGEGFMSRIMIYVH